MSATIPTSSAADHLSTQEKLLFAQAVYKVGAAAWDTVSSLLLAHPASTAKGKDAFSPSGCEALYVDLITGIGQNVPAPDAMKPQNKIHLRLAQTYYIARLSELKAEIETYENGFTVLMGEINALKSGQMDGAVREEVRAGLVKRYGKKLLDWLPPDEAEVREAVEQGPIKDGEVDPTKGSTKLELPLQPEAKETSEKSAEAMEVDAVQEAAPAAEKPKSSKQDKSKISATAKEETQPAKEAEKEVENIVKSPTKPVSKRAKPDSKKGQASSAAEIKSSERAPASETVADPVAASPAASDPLSPIPSAKPAETEPATPAQPASPPAADTASRASKRKASAQPRGAPASKRGTRGRRNTSPDVAASDAASEHDQDAGDSGKKEADGEDADMEQEAATEAEAEETVGRGRRSSKRHNKLDSPPVSTRAKDGSPAASRRAASVASSASTPQPVDEKRRRGGRPGRGMRDDVVSKSVREQSAAVESVKEDEEDGESAAEVVEETRTRSRRGRKETSPVEDKKEKEAPAKNRKTRSAKPTDQGEDEREAEAGSEASPGPAATPAADSKSKDTEKPATKKGPRRSEPKAAQTILFNLLDTIRGHRHGSVFQNPVKKSEAPDYYDVIKRPMDLKKIKQRIKDGEISSIDEFERDILLMFANAMMYNDESSQVYEWAKKMLHETENHIAHYRTMQDDLSK